MDTVAIDNTAFFEKVYPHLLPKVKKIQAAGGVVSLSFYKCAIQKDGKHLSGCTLPASVAVLMKNTAPTSAKAMAETGLQHCIDEAYQILVPEEQTTKLGSLLKDHLIPTPPATKKKVVMSGGKIALKDATELLQAVSGTDSSSTYYVVALSPRMKIAARIKKTALSLRIEGPFTKEDELKASLAGFTKSSSHMSVHVDCQNIPPFAVLGGMLFRLGVSFDKVLSNPEEFKYESK